MEEKDNIIDLGKWNCPRSWKELDLKTFQEIERYYSDKDKKFDIRDVLHILYNRSVDEVNLLPMDICERLIEQLSWLSDSPEYDKPRSWIEIDGIRYQVNIMEKLKTGEFIAVDTAIKGDKHNYAAILAILCRKQGEIYDSKFENEVLPSRIEMFENQSMMDVMPIVSFFLALWVTSSHHIQLSSQVRGVLDLTAKHLETLRKSGDLSLFSTILLRRKLRKLEKSINSI